ncbi:hypothetical protein SAMN05444395_11119 [Flavobacterium fryxellicola]|uniref:Uncharacterized protein n=1 Tax=Flavobacterium fryxellicola TaxID=249352 RepID=A0A167ZKE4_9FLAO|nr:hypothetical protein FBFR_01715 [Flavobacterium fryxellicola]SHN76874.1 hypothetical protein SAMN05444395_11119 [Flavobacterium fryxellicola]
MKQKAYHITLLFFFPVFQSFITTIQFNNIVANIQLEIIFFAILIAILSVMLLFTIIYFCIAIDHWFCSDYKLNKLWPCVICALAIVGIYCTIKAIINTKIERVQNCIRNIPNAIA